MLPFEELSLTEIEELVDELRNIGSKLPYLVIKNNNYIGNLTFVFVTTSFIKSNVKNKLKFILSLKLV